MRTAIALCSALMLAACGADEPTSAERKGPTVLARSGGTLLAVDSATGRVRRAAAGAHDADWRAVYTAQAASGFTTVVATDPATGRRLRATKVAGPWKIPVAAGSTPEGAVSGDGRWLVLAGDGGARHSEFALLPTSLKGKPQRFRLRGRFDFDALSPDGSAIYLSQIERSGRYRVRAYDIREGRLRPQVIVEKTSIGTIMQGIPVARAVDPTGSPVHTLYRGGPAGAFVHSLNTAEGGALCILIPGSKKAGPDWQLRLDEWGTALHALNASLDAHLLIDPFSGEVADAPAGTALPGSRLDDFAVAGGGTLTAGGRKVADLGADAELLAVR